MQISMMGYGEPILKDKRGYNHLPSDRRLPRTYQIYKIEEDLIEKKVRRLKEQRLADIMGLR